MNNHLEKTAREAAAKKAREAAAKKAQEVKKPSYLDLASNYFGPRGGKRTRRHRTRRR